MTPQEIFDSCVRHLYEQGRPSFWQGNCLYRGPDNTRCSIGFFIPDEFYDLGMEGTPFNQLTIRFPQLKDLFDEDNIDIYIALMLAHDNTARVMHKNDEPFTRWNYVTLYNELREAAETFNLDPIVLEELNQKVYDNVRC